VSQPKDPCSMNKNLLEKEGLKFDPKKILKYKRKKAKLN
jgi:hypothetical protein